MGQSPTKASPALHVCTSFIPLRTRQQSASTALPLADARAAALRWLPVVARAGFVSVEVTSDPSQFVLHYDRIWFNFHHAETDLEAVAGARATYIVWCTLAQCAGFGLRENPDFWCDVLDIAQRMPRPPRHANRPLAVPISGSICMWPRHSGEVSIRVALAFEREQFGAYTTVCRLFFGVLVDDTPADIATDLTDVLSQLSPFMVNRRHTHVYVDAAISWRSPLMNTEGLPTLVGQLQQPEVGTNTYRPRFVPSIFRVSVAANSMERSIFTELVETGVAMPHVEPSLAETPLVSQSETEWFMRTLLLPFPAPCVYQQPHTLVCDMVGDAEFKALCATLPYTRSLRSH